MSEEVSVPKGKGFELLNQFELILESDPLIDEVGFIHPSQFASLIKEVESSDSQSKDGILSSELPKDKASDSEDTNFWNRDHKLGISMHVLLPLYEAAKDVFMDAIRQYKTLENLYGTSGNENYLCAFSPLESEIMKHSKALLLLSCDFGTAWNSRKLILSKKQHMSMFIGELLLSALVLSYSPKSEPAWCHRQWVIKMIAGKCSAMQEIVGKESELVEKIAERSKMNYRAWNHRCWLVSFVTIEQALLELKKSRNWAGLHVADNSCFHYRARLILRILEESCLQHEDESSDHNVEIYQTLQEELHWNEQLIRQYIGREALWLYRRLLSLCWVRHFATDPNEITHLSEVKYSIDADINLFLDNELCLVNSFSIIPDDNFEDFQAQAIHSATYILWLAKQIPRFQGMELKKKLYAGNWKTMLNQACPERSSLWANLAAHLEMECLSRVLNEKIY